MKKQQVVVDTAIEGGEKGDEVKTFAKTLKMQEVFKQLKAGEYVKLQGEFPSVSGKVIENSGDVLELQLVGDYNTTTNKGLLGKERGYYYVPNITQLTILDSRNFEG